MATTARDGTGTTVLYGTSSFAADVLTFDGPSQTLEAIDTTTMTTTDSKTFIPAKIKDSGELTMTIVHEGNQEPNIGDALETITVDWSGEGVGHKWAFSGFVTAYTQGAEIDGRMEGSVTIKLSGPITVS